MIVAAPSMIVELADSDYSSKVFYAEVNVRSKWTDFGEPGWVKPVGLPEPSLLTAKELTLRYSVAQT